MGRMLIVSGALILLLGVLVSLLEAGLAGKGSLLPGDIVLRKGNFTLYFPLGLSILLSIVLTILLALFLGNRR